MAGHSGRDRMTEIITRNYDFENLDKYVRVYIDMCDICAMSKPDRHKPYSQLKSLFISQGLLEAITIDFIVKLSPSRDPSYSRGPLFDSILVVVDRFTKMTHLILCHETTTSPQLTYMVIKHIVARHGVPQTIVSDRGKPFISKFTQTLCERLGIG
jgi:hypothetical protein